MTAVLKCDKVSKTYNPSRPGEVRALCGVSLEIEQGSFTLVRGPSGSGKTTLLGLLGGLDRPSNGTVFADGFDLSSFTQTQMSHFRRKSIGFVFQDFRLLRGLVAWENISYPLIPEGVAEADRRSRALSLLRALGLSDRTYHCPEELSGGEQQRVAIARALINDPQVIILDEPTSNIDRDASLALMDILAGLKAQGKTLVVSSHDDDVAAAADRTFELKKGVLASASSDQVAGYRS